MTIRSGCLHCDCITLAVIPEELDAISESGGVAASMSANNLILKSGRSGPFSWTKSACDSASFMLAVKLRRSRDAPGDKPIFSSAGQASSTYWRRLASAFGAGSVAITSNPRARYCAAQLAPITPVPTIAMRRTGLLNDIIGFSSGLGLATHVPDRKDSELAESVRVYERASKRCRNCRRWSDRCRKNVRHCQALG